MPYFQVIADDSAVTQAFTIIGTSKLEGREDKKCEITLNAEILDEIQTDKIYEISS